MPQADHTLTCLSVTHPHDDHCKGFEDNFYHGEVNDYDKDKNKNEISLRSFDNATGVEEQSSRYFCSCT